MVETIEDCITRLIDYIGDDPGREGLLKTPSRVLKSYAELFEGYRYHDADIKEMLTVFEDDTSDEMVLLRDIDFVSFCEHHMLPFVGVAHVAYIPDGKVVGISKLARLVDVFARRLQIQERMTNQISFGLDKHLKPKGVAVVVESTHQCMTCRGVKKQNTTMITSSLLGDFKANDKTRSEFFSLVTKG
jgi:GTP cyclohydrolase I